MTIAKEWTKKDLEDRIPVNRRDKSYVICLDFSSAFDKVDRPLLLQKLREEFELEHCINLVLTGTAHYFQQSKQKYMTAVGVPQGSVLSPDLFNFMINSLLTGLNELALNHITRDKPTRRLFVYAYADDVCLLVRKSILSETIDMIEQWCTNNRFTLNK